MMTKTATTYTRKVLMLDDDPTTLMILSQHLQALGVEVYACREIEAAEAVLDATRVDAVITDLCVSPLGGLDGTRLVRHVTTHYPETEIFVMTSHASEEVRRVVVAFGAVAIFEKPVDPKMLALQVLRGPRGTSAEPSPAAAGVVHDVEPLDDFLARNPVFSVLQPIVGLQGSAAPWEVHGIEALARAPQDSVLRNPEILFGYASRKERVFETDMICVASGLKEAAALGKDAKVFVNIQPRSMTNPDFLRRTAESVERSGIAPGQVVFEITEHETILNPRAFGNTLGRLRDHGFLIALDDFGVGFCNLHLLIDLKPDYVKLPQYFTRGITADRDRQDAVRAVHGLVKLRKAPVIMEGVETAEEHAAVRSLGVEFAQGYYFSRPARAADLKASAAFSWPVPVVV